MNKKLQSLILSGVLAVSMISKPIFAISNEVQEEPKIEINETIESEDTDSITNQSTKVIENEDDATMIDNPNLSETTNSLDNSNSDYFIDGLSINRKMKIIYVDENGEEVSKDDVHINKIKELTINNKVGDKHLVNGVDFECENYNDYLFINLKNNYFDMSDNKTYTSMTVELEDGTTYSVCLTYDMLKSGIASSDKLFYNLSKISDISTKCELNTPVLDEELEIKEELDKEETTTEEDNTKTLETKRPGDNGDKLDIVNGKKQKQSKYIDHVDIKLVGAKLKITVKDSSGNIIETIEDTATVEEVYNVTITLEDGSTIVLDKYTTRTDGGEREFNFNFQTNGKSKPDVEKIKSITFLTKLRTTNNGTYDKVSLTLNGLDDIVKSSVCPNGSGLDYRINSSTTDIKFDVVVKPDEFGVIPEIIPETGDDSVFVNMLSGFIMIITIIILNKKRENDLYV